MSGRLTAGTATAGAYGGLAASWSYDAFGNRTAENFGGSTPHPMPTSSTTSYNASNRVSGSSLMLGGPLGYDAAGDVTTDNLNSYAYDGEGRVCAVGNAAGKWGYLYDAEGSRVAKGTVASLACPNSAASFTAVQEQYLLDAGGEQATELDGSGNWVHTNVLGGDATYDGQGLHFHLKDPLGTRRVQLAAGSGCVEDTFQSLPFGSDLTPNPGCGGGDDATEHHFTGKERDTESGNDYFGARYFGSSMGRFLSPDPKIGSAHAASPQSWNRYSYSLDNPLKFIDPDGKEVVLFYRPPDPNMGSTKDFGHVFLFVRNDKTGRSGFFDYYPDQTGSAVHRSVSTDRIKAHAALIIDSTPEAEDKMLDKMDELTKKNPKFNAGAGGLFESIWNALTGNVNDCVTTSEQILDAGGIDDSSSTPTGLWDDLYTELGNDPDADSDLGAEGIVHPKTGRSYGRINRVFATFSALAEAQLQAQEQQEEQKYQKQQPGQDNDQ